MFIHWLPPLLKYVDILYINKLFAQLLFATYYRHYITEYLNYELIYIDCSEVRAYRLPPRYSFKHDEMKIFLDKISTDA
jgi:hypothetical protein